MQCKNSLYRSSQSPMYPEESQKNTIQTYGRDPEFADYFLAAFAVGIAAFFVVVVVYALIKNGILMAIAMFGLGCVAIFTFMLVCALFYIGEHR